MCLFLLTTADSKAVLQCAGTIIKQNSCSFISQATQRPVESRDAWHTSSPKLGALSIHQKHSLCPVSAWQLLFFSVLKLQHAGISIQVLSASAVEREAKHSIQVVQVTVKNFAGINLVGMLRTCYYEEATLALHKTSSPQGGKHKHHRWYLCCAG